MPITIAAASSTERTFFIVFFPPKLIDKFNNFIQKVPEIKKFIQGKSPKTIDFPQKIS